jgi:hypothetical protein
MKPTGVEILVHQLFETRLADGDLAPPSVTPALRSTGPTLAESELTS